MVAVSAQSPWKNMTDLLAAAKAKAKRTQLAALDTALAAAEKELTALEDAPTRLLALQNREKELAQRSTALTTLNQRLAACQQQAQKAHRAQDAQALTLVVEGAIVRVQMGAPVAEVVGVVSRMTDGLVAAPPRRKR